MEAATIQREASEEIWRGCLTPSILTAGETATTVGRNADGEVWRGRLAPSNY